MNLRDKIWNNIINEIWNHVWCKVDIGVSDEVEWQIREQVHRIDNHIWDKVYSHVHWWMKNEIS